ncbi:MAG: hypothetical protein LBC65_05675 [Oscillospiraceae bacterium]|jgi:hypothetical protein|nr:hypothetical protein [Oscillospiraceae bacterium]
MSTQTSVPKSRSAAVAAWLRVAVFADFALFTTATAASVFASSRFASTQLQSLAHALHIAHELFGALFFVMLFVYLLISADIASKTAYRELKLRAAVDPKFEFIHQVPTSIPTFNVCAGALARSGIYVRSVVALTELGRCKTVAAKGNYPQREGYAITAETLAKIGVALSDDVKDCTVKITLGEVEPHFDFAITQNKITHLLKCVHIARVYRKYSLLSVLILLGLGVAFFTMTVLEWGVYRYAATTLIGAVQIRFVRKIEDAASKLTFAKIVGNAKLRA